MADDPSQLDGQLTDGGIAARHRPVRRLPLFVAPTHTPDGFNAVADPGPRPIACWRIDSHRFAFDSSFILPSSADEFSALAVLRPPSDEEGGLLSVFGHADPTGEDAYNKELSGRRAKAVYALLTRRADL